MVTQNVNTVLASIPGTIKAYTVLNNDDSYTIVLNSRLSYDQHLLSYYHEMKHIENGDYEKNNTIDMIELYAHS